MSSKRGEDYEALAMIVDEIDAARETYDLFQQLSPHLPIRSFEDLAKVGDGEGVISFRGEKFAVSTFEDVIPEIIFPVEDQRKLVQLLVEVVRNAPPHVGRDLSDSEQAKRLARRLSLQMSGGGRIGPPLLAPAGFGGGRGPRLATPVSSSEVEE
jgi:hypothetical protein